MYRYPQLCKQPSVPYMAGLSKGVYIVFLGLYRTLVFLTYSIQWIVRSTSSRIGLNNIEHQVTVSTPTTDTNCHYTLATTG